MSGPRPGVRAASTDPPAARDASPIQPLSGPVLRAKRAMEDGVSRRTLLRRSLGAAAGLLLVELTGGTIGYLWAAGATSAPKVRVGTLADLIATNPGLPVAGGFPAYVAAAKAFVVVLDPSIGAFLPGTDDRGGGEALKVRALSQRCPHLGCRPNPCLEDFWFHCPCHQSRYDRLGIKPAGERFGPAPRGMDRLAIEVDAGGVLTIDSARITLGPLPVVMGQPGLIPPRVQGGCA